jgi:hypothetical protein
LIIRALGVIVGLLSIVVFSIMLFSQHDSLLSSISGILTGLVFLIYGLGGKKALSKILPNTANTNVTK